MGRIYRYSLINQWCSNGKKKNNNKIEERLVHCLSLSLFFVVQPTSPTINSKFETMNHQHHPATDWPAPACRIRESNRKKRGRAPRVASTLCAHTRCGSLFIFSSAFFVLCCFILTQLWGIGRAKLTIIMKKEQEREREREKKNRVPLKYK